MWVIDHTISEIVIDHISETSICDACYMLNLKWLCVLFEESGDISIIDKNREIVTIMKPSKSMVKYTAIEIVNGGSLVAATSDALLIFF